jgi:hypothetical protein
VRPEFDFVTADQFGELARLTKRLLTRKISGIHLHHTFLPTAAFYADLAGPKDRDGEAAGRAVFTRLWEEQAEQLGWDDIAQHVSIDPAGRIWNGRDWNLPPASAAGHNGNATRGPFMMALVGNFENGAEVPTMAQLDSAAAVIAAIQVVFELPPETITLHSELDARCRCPGIIDRAGLVAAAQKRRSAVKTDAHSAPGPLADKQLDVHRLLGRGQRSATAGALGDEPPGCGASLEVAAGRSVGARGGADDGGAITPEMFRLLRPHVIHLRSGRFVTDGRYATTPSDVRAIVEKLAAWAQTPAAAAGAPSMIWAHGGLNALEPALAYAWSTYRWWIASGIYPIYFVWETGAVETALQIVEELRGPKQRGLDEVDDWVVETLVHAVGRRFWQQMKVSAENASMKGEDRGAFVFARLLGKLFAAKSGPKPGVHVVGHSAGAIFHGHFVAAAVAAGVPVESLTLLAPACTVDFFDRMIQPRLGQIPRYRQFVLDRATEIADTTVPVYDKSLLYLVSRGFEDRRGEPVLGLEESIRQDDGLLDLFGLDGGARKVTLVVAPTADGTARGVASGATEHGAFDDDPATLEAIRADILGNGLASDAPSAPRPPNDRGATRLYRTLRETYPFAYAERPASASAVATAAPGPTAATGPRAGGALRALSIGIDAYPSKPLKGCVRDSEVWTGLLTSLGFEVTTLREGQATREGILAAIQALVRSGGAGDVLAIHYSGHGIQLPNDDGDAEADDKDEALVPVDGIESGRYVLDDDLRRILGTLHREARLTFFADCCHSGTMSRFAVGASGSSDFIERYIDPTPEMIATYRRARATRSLEPEAPEGGEDKMTHLLFAACRDYQTAKESEGSGWFTRVATGIIREMRAPMTNFELRRRIEQEFARLGYSQADQTPELEGRVDAKEGLVLGGLVIGAQRP